MILLANSKRHSPAKKPRMTGLKRAGYFTIAVAILAAVLVVMVVKSGISKSTNERACAVMRSTAQLQTTILKDHLEEQYDPLLTASAILATGEVFGSESARPALNAIKQTHELRIFGFADLDGNVTSCDGEVVGNIRHRAYFQNIVYGAASRQCEYVDSTPISGKPRIIFASPAYDWANHLIGVIFASKELDVLGRALFENDIFGSDTDYFICDAAGNILVSNEPKHIRDLIHDSPVPIYETIPEFRDMGRDKAESKQVEVNGETLFVSMAPLNVNDWEVGCVVHRDVVTREYAGAAQTIQHMSYMMTGIIGIAMGYVLLLALQSILQKRRELRVIGRYNQNYKTLLREMNCTVVEYDPEKLSVDLIDDSCRIFELDKLARADSSYWEYQAQHPEFDFNQLNETAAIVLEKREPQSFESIFNGVNGEPHWLKVILIPLLSDMGYVKVLGTTVDVTGMHKEFEKMAETFTEIPSGIHRCYLSDPIHLEYYSEGLCKMIGYTYAEVSKILGPEMDYCQLIHPEDRSAFDDFCIDMAKDGGKRTVEYRMLCKDGSVIVVSDTMEAKRKSSGIMYGYSVVSDLQKYKEVQAELEAELAETKANLEKLKIKNFTSQMQPHFLYNALASIREIVLDDPEYASELLCDFTTHLRACLRSITSDVLIPFSQELENIEAYVRIEKMRFGDRLTIRYECEEQDFHIIPLSIQPLVENAIRHGIYERGKDGGTVIVRTARRGNNIEIVVEDNGVGFDYDTIMQEIKDSKRDSTGVFNLIFRFEKILNATVQVESRLHIGTRITVLIPIKEEAL